MVEVEITVVHKIRYVGNTCHVSCLQLPRIMRPPVICNLFGRVLKFNSKTRNYKRCSACIKRVEDSLKYSSEEIEQLDKELGP